MIDFAGTEDYRTNETLESEAGVWFRFRNGMRFRCKRAGGSNDQYRRVFQREIKPFKRQLDSLDREVQEEIFRNVYAETILVDWDGVRDKGGNEVPFTKANVKALFEALPELFVQVRDNAEDYNNYLDSLLQEDAEALGNS